jgi:hypothetical protein
MKKKMLFIALLALLLTSQQSLVSPALKPSETAATQSPNIILIFMDDRAMEIFPAMVPWISKRPTLTG